MQVLTKKLDSLEEFRQQKEQLMTKFEKLESDSKQKMADYEAKIYDLEKSHIREQDRLKVRYQINNNTLGIVYPIHHRPFFSVL